LRAHTTIRRTLTATAGALAAAAALAAPAAADGHTVRSGETLSGIAAANHTTVAALAEANHLADRDHIVIGQVLVVPGSASAPATVIHVVAPGENLAGIARHYGTTVSAIASANGIGNPNLVRIGSRLTIPAGSGAAAPANRTYTVGPGDTLGAIARRFGVSQGAIVAANSLRNPNVVRLGQVLTIPAASGGATGSSGGGTAYARTGGSDGRTGVSGTYTVRAGDTLAAIARQYGVTQAQLMAANGILPPGSLYTGTRLQLTAQNRLPDDIARCPVPGSTFVNSWGFGRSGGRAHEGTDMMAGRGTPVVAPVDGTVSFATGTIGGHQFRLRGDDGTTYIGSHMDRFGTSGRVRAGDVIGYVGTTGNAAGGTPHLHFEVHPDNGNAMNPYPVLRLACG
jgi:LysM repeat protein